MAAAATATHLERAVHKFLTRYRIPFQTEASCAAFTAPSGICYRFDILIPHQNTIIEVDGPHHFEQIYKNRTLEQTINDDVNKMIWAATNGYSVIRISHFALARFGWYDPLLKALGECARTKEPIRRYINFREYAGHIDCLREVLRATPTHF